MTIVEEEKQACEVPRSMGAPVNDTNRAWRPLAQYRYQLKQRIVVIIKLKPKGRAEKI
jgi:hypothetical protein